ncbi:hypothetical protein Kisp01_41770 [Kineosporia sp. NBRC 101677]|uniref:hypothetical protein n=1 Tax=Kineosporia sp. NBRC 101677 TaxID=3032197 RepID=UPI0024A469A9|nr:hypothetical protein [Kineosporia sp. NBRC 101677]GLY17162.1 hypothetical protein Kisp01_41770 [Kineosporia sp. NBRC 101677]
MSETDVVLRARRRQNRWLGILALVSIVLTPLLYGVLFVLSDGDSPLFWVVLTLAVTAAALIPLGLVVWLRRRGTAWAQPSLLLGVDKNRRKAVVKAVRAGQPVEERDHEVAVNTAQGLVRQRRLLWMVPFFLLLWTFNLLDGEFEPWDVLIIVGIVGVTASVPFQIRDSRRGRAWLEKYGPTKGLDHLSVLPRGRD